MNRMKDNTSPNKTTRQDTLYSRPREAIAGFVFDEAVVSVFEDMIGRSVPGYTTLLSMFPVLAHSFVTPGSACYDLGCSLGAATLAMQQGIQSDDVSLLAIDNSPAMIEACQSLILKHPSKVNVQLMLADINNVEIKNASIVMMNFTLQFIAEDLRSDLVKKIYQGLNANGAFVLSEKIKMTNASEQTRLTTLHHNFKKANGYSQLEISQKRAALENVLVAETVDQHIARLKQAGFSEVFIWFQCFNFVSFLAIK